MSYSFKKLTVTRISGLNLQFSTGARADSTLDLVLLNMAKANSNEVAYSTQCLIQKMQDNGRTCQSPSSERTLLLWDKDLIERPHFECLRSPKLAQFVEVRFRFDKSKLNFTKRKFKRVSGNPLCIVKSTLSILQRADMLGIPQDYPIGAYRPKSTAPGQIAFLTRENVQEVMQFACRLAYPNPQHYMRTHCHLLMSHSNRVTAAVAMFNAGLSIEVIAQRLRWSEESVKYYLRDCFKAIGSLTEKAIEGAFLN